MDRNPPRRGGDRPRRAEATINEVYPPEGREKVRVILGTASGKLKLGGVGGAKKKTIRRTNTQTRARAVQRV